MVIMYTIIPLKTSIRLFAIQDVCNTNISIGDIATLVHWYTALPTFYRERIFSTQDNNIFRELSFPRSAICIDTLSETIELCAKSEPILIHNISKFGKNLYLFSASWMKHIE